MGKASAHEHFCRFASNGEETTIVLLVFAKAVLSGNDEAYASCARSLCLLSNQIELGLVTALGPNKQDYRYQVPRTLREYHRDLEL